MGRIGLAFKTFFGILFNAETAARVAQAHQPPRLDPPAPVPPPPAAPPVAPKPARSEALTLLAALQREARLVDFLQEALDDYDDAQVGAAVRDVHRQCRQLLQRYFGIQPIVSQTEGSRCEVTSQDSAGMIRLTGQVTESRPVTGTLVHSGWQATQCELPVWTGSASERLIIAPAEVELSR